MRRVKIGTAIDAALLAKARAAAVKRRKPLNVIIEESLERYLESEGIEDRSAVVRRTRGQLQAPIDLVDQILEEPYLEA